MITQKNPQEMCFKGSMITRIYNDFIDKTRKMQKLLLFGLKDSLQSQKERTVGLQE